MTATATRPNRTSAEQANVEIAIMHLFEHAITFNQTLGMKMMEFGEAPSIKFEMRSDLVGHFLYGRLHGGVISATLDAVGGFAIMCGISAKHPADSAQQVMERFSKLGTIDLHVDYLRPGIGNHFIATAKINRLGGRIGSTQMALHNDEGLLIATGSANYIVT